MRLFGWLACIGYLCLLCSNATYAYAGNKFSISDASCASLQITSAQNKPSNSNEPETPDHALAPHPPLSTEQPFIIQRVLSKPSLALWSSADYIHSRAPPSI